MDEPRYKFRAGSYYLRPIEPDDALLVAQWRNTPEARAAFFSGDEVVTPDSHRLFCEQRGAHDLVWMAGIAACAVQKDEDMLIGMVSLTVDVKHRTAKFGRLLVAPECAGMGLAEKIARLAMIFGFDVLGLDRLWLEVYADNTKAKELYDRIGWSTHMRMESEPREIHQMSYFAEDWNRV